VGRRSARFIEGTGSRRIEETGNSAECGSTQGGGTKEGEKKRDVTAGRCPGRNAGKKVRVGLPRFLGVRENWGRTRGGEKKKVRLFWKGQHGGWQHDSLTMIRQALDLVLLVGGKQQRPKGRGVEFSRDKGGYFLRGWRAVGGIRDARRMTRGGSVGIVVVKLQKELSLQ